MKLQANAVRKKLVDGGCATGAAIYSWSPNVIDAAVLAGLDYIRIDAEHAWRKDDMLEHLIRAAIMGGVVPIVRVDRDDPFLVRKVLEIGAGGVIVPDVSSATQAESAVRAAKFPPLGNRGLSRNCWSAAWGTTSGEEWIEWSNREPMIGIMIENVEAISAIDDIIAVEGLDFVLFGPADYSMSIGLAAPNANDERVQDAIAKTAAATRAAGKYFSMATGNDPEKIDECLRLGVNMLELSNDLGVLRTQWSQAKTLIGVANSSA